MFFCDKVIIFIIDINLYKMIKDGSNKVSTEQKITQKNIILKVTLFL